MVSIDWGIFWQIVNFFILMFLLTKFLYKPITEVLEKRSNNIEDNLSQAEKRRQEAEKLKAEYEGELSKARQDAQEIISQARQQGEQEKEKIVQEANQEAKLKLEKAQKEIARNKKEALSELRNEVAGISVLIAQKLIEQSIDKSSQQKIVNEYIDKLDGEKIGETP